MSHSAGPFEDCDEGQDQGERPTRSMRRFVRGQGGETYHGRAGSAATEPVRSARGRHLTTDWNHYEVSRRSGVGARLRLWYE